MEKLLVDGVLINDYGTNHIELMTGNDCDEEIKIFSMKSGIYPMSLLLSFDGQRYGNHFISYEIASEIKSQNMTIRSHRNLSPNYVDKRITLILLFLFLQDEMKMDLTQEEYDETLLCVKTYIQQHQDWVKEQSNPISFLYFNYEILLNNKVLFLNDNINYSALFLAYCRQYLGLELNFDVKLNYLLEKTSNVLFSFKENKPFEEDYKENDDVVFLNLYPDFHLIEMALRNHHFFRDEKHYQMFLKNISEIFMYLYSEFSYSKDLKEIIKERENKFKKSIINSNTINININSNLVMNNPMSFLNQMFQIDNEYSEFEIKKFISKKEILIKLTNIFYTTWLSMSSDTKLLILNHLIERCVENILLGLLTFDKANKMLNDYLSLYFDYLGNVSAIPSDYENLFKIWGSAQATLFEEFHCGFKIKNPELSFLRSPAGMENVSDLVRFYQGLQYRDFYDILPNLTGNQSSWWVYDNNMTQQIELADNKKNHELLSQKNNVNLSGKLLSDLGKLNFPYQAILNLKPFSQLYQVLNKNSLGKYFNNRACQVEVNLNNIVSCDDVFNLILKDWFMIEMFEENDDDDFSFHQEYKPLFCVNTQNVNVNPLFVYKLMSSPYATSAKDYLNKNDWKKVISVISNHDYFLRDDLAETIKNNLKKMKSI